MYEGFIRVKMTDEQYVSICEDPYGEVSRDFIDEYGLLDNQYVDAYKSDYEQLGIFRVRDKSMTGVPYKTIRNKFLGEIKPRNPHQQMAIDMLRHQDSTIKVLTGKFGTGKSMLMCATALDLIHKGVYDRIVYVRNNIEVKNSKPIGHLPGTYEEKLMPFAMPLADHVGGLDGLLTMMTEGEVEIVHLGFIRGRDIKNSIIMCSEAENLTKEHIQLLIGRVGEGSSLWIDGDFKQTDAEVFQKNSGLYAVINKLKGHRLFGYVNLQKTERSETAALADLLD